MVVPEQSKLYTMEEFKEFVSRPENSDRLFELINGEIIEVTPGRTRYSEYHDILSFAVRLFCKEHNLPCHTSTADGAFAILGHTFAPDFAYKRTPMSDDYPDPEPPLWVVEIISPTDKPWTFERNDRSTGTPGFYTGKCTPICAVLTFIRPANPCARLA